VSILRTCRDKNGSLDFLLFGLVSLDCSFSTYSSKERLQSTSANQRPSRRTKMANCEESLGEQDAYYRRHRDWDGEDDDEDEGDDEDEDNEYYQPYYHYDEWPCNRPKFTEPLYKVFDESMVHAIPSGVYHFKNTAPIDYSGNGVIVDPYGFHTFGPGGIFATEDPWAWLCIGPLHECDWKCNHDEKHFSDLASKIRVMHYVREVDPEIFDDPHFVSDNFDMRTGDHRIHPVKFEDWRMSLASFIKQEAQRKNVNVSRILDEAMEANAFSIVFIAKFFPECVPAQGSQYKKGVCDPRLVQSCFLRVPYISHLLPELVDETTHENLLVEWKTKRQLPPSLVYGYESDPAVLLKKIIDDIPRLELFPHTLIKSLNIEGGVDPMGVFADAVEKVAPEKIGLLEHAFQTSARIESWLSSSKKKGQFFHLPVIDLMTRDQLVRCIAKTREFPPNSAGEYDGYLRFSEDMWTPEMAAAFTKYLHIISVVPKHLITTEMLVEFILYNRYSCVPEDLRTPELDVMSVLSFKTDYTTGFSTRQTLIDNYITAKNHTLEMTRRVIEANLNDAMANSGNWRFEFLKTVPRKHLFERDVAEFFMHKLLSSNIAAEMYRVLPEKWHYDLDLACVKECPECIGESRMTDSLSMKLDIRYHYLMTKKVKAKRRKEHKEYTKATGKSRGPLLDCYPIDFDRTSSSCLERGMQKSE
jgi:hypothetical protein